MKVSNLLVSISFFMTAYLLYPTQVLSQKDTLILLACSDSIHEIDIFSQFDFTDVDGDGVEEMVVLHKLTQRLVVYRYTISPLGLPMFSIIVEEKLNKPLYFDICDWNQDGIEDIIVSEMSSSRDQAVITFIPKNQIFSFSTMKQSVKTQFELGASESFSFFKFIDINNDGKLDFVGKLIYYIHETTDFDIEKPLITKYQYVYSETTKQLIFTDFDGDKDIDLLAPNPSYGDHLWLENIDGSIVSTKPHIFLKNIGNMGFNSGDIDNDGDEDLIYLTDCFYDEDHKLYVFDSIPKDHSDLRECLMAVFNIGKAQFKDSAEFIFEFPPYANSVDVADFDNDGLYELIYTSEVVPMEVFRYNPSTNDLESLHYVPRLYDPVYLPYDYFKDDTVTFGWQQMFERDIDGDGKIEKFLLYFTLLYLIK